MYYVAVNLRFRFSCFFSSRRRHTRWTGDWSSDVCSSDLLVPHAGGRLVEQQHFRVERQGGGEFQRALAAVRQLGRRRGGEGGEADIGDEGERAAIVFV